MWSERQREAGRTWVRIPYRNQISGVIALRLTGSKLSIGHDVLGILAPKASFAGGARAGRLGSIPFDQQWTRDVQQSLIQDSFNNGFAQSGQRERRFMGTKEHDTPPPSKCD